MKPECRRRSEQGRQARPSFKADRSTPGNIPVRVTTDTDASSLPTDPADGHGPPDGTTEKQRGAHRQLITGSAVLVVAAAMQAVGGAVFWLIAANVDAKAVVGTATALFTSVNFVTYVAGLGSAGRAGPVRGRPQRRRGHDLHLVDPGDGRRRRRWSAPRISAFLRLVHPPSTEPLFRAGAIWQAAFVVSIVGAALSMIFDVRCMTLRRWDWVLGRIIDHLRRPAATGALVPPPGAETRSSGSSPGR